MCGAISFQIALWKKEKYLPAVIFLGRIYLSKNVDQKLVAHESVTTECKAYN